MKLSVSKLFLTTLVFSGLLVSCNNSGGDEIVIGTSLLSMQNEFVVSVSDEMEKKAKESGVRLITVDAERSALKQVEQIESFIAQGVDAIILNPCEVEASSPAVKKALAANIPIINVNSETSEQPTAFIGSDDVESGRIAMRYIVDKTGGKGKVIMIHGYMGQAAQIQRAEGAKEILASTPGLELIAEQSGQWDRAKSMSLMENWIQSYGSQISAVFAQNDEMAMGAVKALTEAGLKDKVIVVGIDAIPDALQAVKKGTLDATVFQNAREQGSQAVATALSIIQGQPYEQKVMIPFELVTPENVENYLK
jgi:inositol transport system substrate-binding protein